MQEHVEFLLMDLKSKKTKNKKEKKKKKKIMEKLIFLLEQLETELETTEMFCEENTEEGHPEYLYGSHDQYDEYEEEEDDADWWK